MILLLLINMEFQNQVQAAVVYPDILFVPLVAFDKNLNRLGYGAGYYDRLIKIFKKKEKKLLQLV